MEQDKVQEIIEQLNKPLDPRHVKPPPQGKYGEYLEAWHVINEANRIFGFDGWSYEVMGSPTLTNASEENGSHKVGYFASVRVHVRPLNRTTADVGHGQGHGKSEGGAHESAVKEAVTDALKRALRTFGNPFGHALYDKEKRDVGIDPTEAFYAKIKNPKLKIWFQENGIDQNTEPKERADSTADCIVGMLKRKKTMGELDNEWERWEKSIDGLETGFPEIHARVVQAYETKQEEFSLEDA